MQKLTSKQHFILPDVFTMDLHSFTNDCGSSAPHVYNGYTHHKTHMHGTQLSARFPVSYYHDNYFNNQTLQSCNLNTSSP